MGNGEKTRKPGWHSRRHQTSGPHDGARARYTASRGRLARQRRAAERMGLMLPFTATSDDLRTALAHANFERAHGRAAA